MFLTFLAFVLPTASAQCGSLLTYRQHADLLQTAPQCLRDGCVEGQNSSTISSPCPSSSPCRVYWDMFVEQFDQKHTWCAFCSSDLACRISGWPVLNATAVCDTTPNHFLFGSDGCCTQNDEPFQLAEWTGSLCNESEWRQPFDICGGMACLDWREWIMPWNWTVRNELLPPDQQVCTAPSKYLSIYAVEHFFWLLFAAGIGYLRLWIARHEEKKNRSVLRYFLLSAWSGFRKKFKQDKEDVWSQKDNPDGEHLRPTLTEKLRWGFPVIMGVFLAGLQLGFNFLAANQVRKQPGYHDVPLGLLALLFCCRPRLSWLSCLLALWPKTLLVKIFKFEEKGDGLWAAKLVLSSVAVTSAVTEAIMQLLGAYFLGRTAQIGQQRGFYISHHLKPKMHGFDAHIMYLGALFWVLLCIPMVVVWFFIALFFGQVFNAVSSWRRGIFNFLHPKTPKIPKLVQGPVEWLLDYVNPDTTPGDTASEDEKLPKPDPDPIMLQDPDQPWRTDGQSFYDQPTRYEGPATGSLYNDQPMLVGPGSATRRSPYAPSHQSELEDQIMPIPPAASGSYRSSPGTYGGLQRRTASGSQYNAVAQHDTSFGDDDQIMPMPRAASGSHRSASGGYVQNHTGPQRRTTSGSQYNSLPQQDTLDGEEDQILPLPANNRRPEMRQTSGNESHHSLLAPELRVVPPSSSGNSSSPKRSDYTRGVSWKWAHWERKIVFAGAFLGMLAYASQWMFWDGFVKAAGDRFCPPKPVDVGAIWWGGALLYVGFPFMGY